MAQKPRKSVIQNILKNLVDSEIPGIQEVVKELTDWTKQLEERSWKIQHYASEIEEATAEEETEIPEEASLADLVKNLEKTLAQLRQKPEVGTAEAGPGKAKPAKAKPSAVKPVKPEAVKAAPQKAAPVETGPARAEAVEVEPAEPEPEAIEEEPVKPVPESAKRDGINRPDIRETFGLRGLRQTVPYVEPAPRSEEEREGPKEETTETYITPEGFIVKRARK
jgi:DNA repair exonuclease SbcCD ATPase subunit